MDGTVEFLSNVKIGTAILAGIVAIFLFILGKGYELTRDFLRIRRLRRNLIRALYAEIDFNTRDLTRFVNETDINYVIKRLREDPDRIPLITDARHTLFYTSRLPEMQFVSNRVIGRIVHFYGRLERLRVQIESIGAEAYMTLDVDARIAVVQRVFKTANTCKNAGEGLMKAMENDYTGLHLERLRERPERTP